MREGSSKYIFPGPDSHGGTKTEEIFELNVVTTVTKKLEQ